MSLKINEEILTRDGFTVPSGTIVRFRTTFEPGVIGFTCSFNFYKDQATVDSGMRHYKPQLLINPENSWTIDYADFTGLTPTQIHVYAKDYLETIFTGGTIDIVM